MVKPGHAITPELRPYFVQPKLEISALLFQRKYHPRIRALNTGGFNSGVLPKIHLLKAFTYELAQAYNI